MDAMRCKACGDVRWSILGLTVRAPSACELCGGEMVRERRRPNRGMVGAPRTERRQMTPLVGTPAPQDGPRLPAA